MRGKILVSCQYNERFFLSAKEGNMLRFNGKIPFGILTLSLVVLFLSGCAGMMERAKPDYTVAGTDMDFVFVKGGTFEMGSTERPDEQPVHSVAVDDLFVGMYEVTFEQFEQYCNAISSCEPPSDNRWGRDDRPVIYVSWHDANAYAQWLSTQTGLQFRLPTEAEWEYFARAGTTTPFWQGDTVPQGSANCRDCGSQWDNQMTAPVGSLQPNPWKLYDTAGNVAEWVLDDYKHGYEQPPTFSTPHPYDGSTRKVIRGGAWSESQNYRRSSARDRRLAIDRKDDTGFRMILLPSNSVPIPE
jgi:formylglycine-generating enzyme required for sulfatase activity